MIDVCLAHPPQRRHPEADNPLRDGCAFSDAEELNYTDNELAAARERWHATRITLTICAQIAGRLRPDLRNTAMAVEADLRRAAEDPPNHALAGDETSTGIVTLQADVDDELAPWIAGELVQHGAAVETGPR